MVKNNLLEIQKRIDKAIANRTQSKLTGDSVQLIAVTKTHPAETVKEALAAGLNVFGENKVQEAESKIPLVGGGKWHLIGHLQTNKVKKAVSLFDLIYSIDSINLLLSVDKEAEKQNKIQDVLLQVNIAKEESKFGFSIEEVSSVLDELKNLSNIRLRGLMVIAPEVENTEEIRPVLKKGYELFCEIKNLNIKSSKVDILSMGMSGDFEIAIEEGANNIRLGTLIFGKRDYLNQ